MADHSSKPKPAFGSLAEYRKLIAEIERIVPPLQIIEGMEAEQFTMIEKIQRFNQLRELLYATRNT